MLNELPSGWSTSSAAETRPRALQNRHSGSSARISKPSLCQDCAYFLKVDGSPHLLPTCEEAQAIADPFLARLQG
jgi:hypothetical protein